MPCYYPMTLYRSREGRNANGSWPLASIVNGYADMPVTVPCGRCVGCRLERSRQWAIRCVHESSLHQENSFVTLTYRDEELTWGDQRPTLVPRDLQLFMKRLRKKYGSGIRFFACGEYGERYGRPHYHACLFGVDFQDKKLLSTKNGNKIYRSDSLSSLWPHGDNAIGDVTFDSAAYVARYIMAKKLGETESYYAEQSIEPEFVRMSRKPGIASNWLKKWKRDVFPSDNLVIRGIQCQPPKYYLSQYEISDPVKYLRVKAKRKNKQNENASNNTSYQLRIRRIVKESRIKLLTRNLE